MSEPTLQAQIDAANAYEQLFVPALFQEWAPRVIAAARIQPGHRVLDVACGTGVLAFEAATCVGPSGCVAGVDSNPGMLAVAAQHGAGIEWRRGAAESLPYADRSFDAVVCQFGLMFFTDRRLAVREMLRVLALGGHLAVAVWASLDQMPAYAAEVGLLDRVAGRRAADALRAPFALGDLEDLTALFIDAGFGSVAVTTLHGTAKFPSIRSMVEADLRGWLPMVGVILTEEQIARILEEAEDVLSPFLTADGRLTFGSAAHIVTGTKE